MIVSSTWDRGFDLEFQRLLTLPHQSLAHTVQFPKFLEVMGVLPHHDAAR